MWLIFFSTLARFTANSESPPPTTENALDNAIALLFYQFSNFNLKKDVTYHIVLSANGYSPTATKALHLAKMYDPVYTNSSIALNPTPIGRLNGHLLINGDVL